MSMMKVGWRIVLAGGILFLAMGSGWAEPVRVTHGADVVEVEAVAPGVVRVQVEPGGRTTPRTLTIDPAFAPGAVEGLKSSGKAGQTRRLVTGKMSVEIEEAPVISIVVKDAGGRVLVSLKDPVGDALHNSVAMTHDASEALYGMRGTDRDNKAPTILRTDGAKVAQGVQGDGGAPFFFTTKYGVLIDSDGGEFVPHGETLDYDHVSRPDAEIFIAVGGPMEVMGAFEKIAGRSPMSPRWTLGFLNSQWGSTEAELKEIINEYAAKQEPISGFILDFDWKAWGEDNYGEWRWNSQAGKGNPFPDKYPDGASGVFGAEMLKMGVHLTGILKPRILVNTVDGTPTEASAYATAHNLWYPAEKRENDYFTHRLAGNIDFNKAEARSWYWEHLIPSFKAGISAWWNDEADLSSTTIFNNFQFLNMSRALYEGQRSISDERAWSINRAYYLGSNRYGAAEWSGDIHTGFDNMAMQRTRMVAALDTGLEHWSMDTGGFIGHPSNENYARWMEFAAFVPVFRVHGDYNQKRQPWVYGPVAEAAAKKAMRLRYDLLPYIYSYERENHDTGVGIVRPLFWVFPDDARVKSDTRSWMFGDALLVSPIVAEGETKHTLYLPAGTWFDFWSGNKTAGSQEISVPVDARAWSDIPLYVRGGSIVAMQPATTGNAVSLKTPLELDVFPSEARRAEFTVYDDDGHTYGYEKGAYFKQAVAAEVHGSATQVVLGAVEGSYKTEIPSYLLRVHQAGSAVTEGKTKLKKFASQADFSASTEPGWAAAEDRFGPVTLVRIAPGASATVAIR
jgi:alpha-glucosidase